MSTQGTSEQAPHAPAPKADGSAGPAWTWLTPALSYAVMLGLIGITTKLAMDGLSWQELYILVAAAYAITTVLLIALGGVRLTRSRAGVIGAVSGFFAAASLMFFFLALEQGDAGKVVPTTAAYPVFTAAVAAIVLHEKVTPVRLLGTLLVVAGIVLIGLE